MNALKRVSLAAGAGLLLAGCYGSVLTDIVKSFGASGDPKITTVAGTGKAGYAGDEGPATSARLNQPHGIAVDAAGNLYIADTNNNVIRMVTPDGIIHTVAGNGTAGYGGDSGQATQAQMNSPLSVAVDAAGTKLYVADASNDRVREFTVGDIISTVAGTGARGYSGDGAATSEKLANPTGVAVAPNGDLYIADFDNTIVRKVTGSNISLAAGLVTGSPAAPSAGYSGDGGFATSAQLNYPYDVAVDSAGNLYIADTTNTVIRKVDAATGRISTVAGDGSSGFGGDDGPATSASMTGPTGVATDADGNLYIADWQNSVIRRVDTNGTITTVAGNIHLGKGYAGDGGVATAAMLNLPWSMAVDSHGNIYIADTYNNRIRKVSR